MPIYEYKCKTCEESFEVEQSIKDDTLTTLPGDDHEHEVKKVFHAPGISFKGDGFYKNDARGKSKKSESSSDSTSSDSNKSDSTKSDSNKKNGDSSSSDTKKSSDSKKSTSKSVSSSSD